MKSMAKRYRVFGSIANCCPIPVFVFHFCTNIQIDSGVSGWIDIVSGSSLPRKFAREVWIFAPKLVRHPFLRILDLSV